MRRAAVSITLALSLLGSVCAADPPPPPPAPASAPAAVVSAVPTSVVTRARVVVVENAQSVVAFNPQLEIVRTMVDRGLTHLTGQPSAREAWRSLVSAEDVVGFKVFTAAGRGTGTRPAVVEAMVQSLLAAGQAPAHVVVWDRQYSQLQQAGLTGLAARYGIRVEGALEAGYDTNSFYESAFLGQPVWGDLEFGERGPGVGRKSYVSRLVTTGMTKIVNLTPLLNHNLAGVSGNLFSLALGSVDNTVRFLNDSSQLALAIPEIYALPVLGDRVVLSVVDALMAQYYGEERSLLHYSGVLGQLRFSTDPVALDVLSIRELERQRELVDAPPLKTDPQLYLNAALVEIGVSDPRSVLIEWVR